MNKPRWKRFARKLNRRSTLHERIFKHILEELDAHYTQNKVLAIPNCRPIIVDFYVFKPVTIIFEIDGLYHALYNQRLKDKIRDHNVFTQTGVKIYRFTNEDIDVNRLEVYDKVKSIFKEGNTKHIFGSNKQIEAWMGHTVDPTAPRFLSDMKVDLSWI